MTTENALARVTKASAVQIADGRIYGPGERIEFFDPTEPHNARLVKRGAVVWLVRQPALTGKALEERARELDITGRSEMTADQLREAIKTVEENAVEQAELQTAQTNQEEST